MSPRLGTTVESPRLPERPPDVGEGPRGYVVGGNPPGYQNGRRKARQASVRGWDQVVGAWQGWTLTLQISPGLTRPLGDAPVACLCWGGGGEGGVELCFY
jgi:hypothetical protein